MRVPGRHGFTVAEVMVAVAVLSVGLLALAGTAALTGRMVGLGQQATRAGLAAAARLDYLRHVAASTVPACGAPEWRSDSAGGTGVEERWDILDGSGSVRRVRLVLRSRVPTGVRRDTLVTAVRCPP